MVMQDIERLWEQLLTFIEEGRVIPVIGPELLMVDIDGRTVQLYSYLAEQLANRLQIPPEPADTLNAVACRFLSQSREMGDIYYEINKVMPPLSRLKLPDPLVKLAEIPLLKLFVTTSFDPLLAGVLNKIRYEGRKETQVLSFFPESKTDLSVELDQLDQSTVFHLFGQLSVAPEYAVTDEDVLEYMHALQSKESRPEKLFDAMVNQYLMVIGCPLCGWLGRFFVRIGKKARLIVPSGKTDFLAGDQLQEETQLMEFLQYFSTQTKVFPLGSIEFVDELHRRWFALHPPGQEPEPTEARPEINEPMKNGAVFLSYASEDRSTVMSIKQAFEKAGIEVWFDRNPDALHAGDKFEAKIKTNIEQCSLFVPIISRNTLTTEPRFFRLEWNHAIERKKYYSDSRRFIIPVVIDDTPPNDPNVDETFRHLHWEKVAGGSCRMEFLSEIKQLQRAYRRGNG